MSGGSFFERIDHLKEEVGTGELEMKVTTDLPYAGVQEVGRWATGPDAGAVIRNHPGGGTTHFARHALFDNVNTYMEHLAGSVLTESGSDLREGAIDTAEEMARKQGEISPRRAGRLAASASPSVTDDGAVIYQRPGAGRA